MVKKISAQDTCQTKSPRYDIYLRVDNLVGKILKYIFDKDCQH